MLTRFTSLNVEILFDTVRPRFKCYQDALELLHFQGKLTADEKPVILEQSCDKKYLQLVNGLIKLTSNGDR